MLEMEYQQEGRDAVDAIVDGAEVAAAAVMVAVAAAAVAVAESLSGHELNNGIREESKKNT